MSLPCRVCLCVQQVRIDKFSIEADPQQLPGGTRYYVVKGEAIERFAQVRAQPSTCQLQDLMVPHDTGRMCFGSTPWQGAHQVLQR